MLEDRNNRRNDDQGGEIWEQTLSGQNEWEKLEVVGYTAFEAFAAGGVWPPQESDEHQAYQLLQTFVSDRLEAFADDPHEYISLIQGLTFRSPVVGKHQDGGIVLGAQAILYDDNNQSMVFDYRFLYPLPEGVISNLVIVLLEKAQSGAGRAITECRIIPLYSPAAFRSEVKLLSEQTYESPDDLSEASLIGSATVRAAEQQAPDRSFSQVSLQSQDGRLDAEFDCGRGQRLFVGVMLDQDNGRLLYDVRGPR